MTTPRLVTACVDSVDARLAASELAAQEVTAQKITQTMGVCTKEFTLQGDAAQGVAPLRVAAQTWLHTSC